MLPLRRPPFPRAGVAIDAPCAVVSSSIDRTFDTIKDGLALPPFQASFLEECSASRSRPIFSSEGGTEAQDGTDTDSLNCARRGLD
jgi:hypothetical protein